MDKPTYKEWLEARQRIQATDHTDNDALTTAAIGLRPPEPKPKPWTDLSGKLSVASKISERITVSIAVPRAPHKYALAYLDADDAEAMVGALNEHIDYLRDCDPPLTFGGHDNGTLGG
jgi:hypothetical protein